MTTNTTMTYGGVNISPVPIINIQRQNIQVGHRELPIGYTFTMTMNGVLTPLPDAEGSFVAIDGLMENLRQTFSRDGLLLEIKCGDTDIMQIYPRIKSISFAESSSNWVNTVPYTIEIEYDTDEITEHDDAAIPPYISDFSEEWSVEFVQDHRYFTWDLSTVIDQQGGYEYATNDGNNKFEMRVTHNISATGKQSWAGPGTTGTRTNAADNAMTWLLSGAFTTGDVYNGSNSYDPFTWGHNNGFLNLDYDGYVAVDEYRTTSVNEAAGSANLSQSWVILGGSSLTNRKVSETFNIDVRGSLDSDAVVVSINGEIRGYEDRSYTGTDLATNVTGQAYTHARNAFAELSDRIFPRAQLMYEIDYSSSRGLNPIPLSKSIGHNPSQGIVSYAYEFSNRPCAFITGALSENFTISDTNPSDVFARLTIIGRAQGPLLQSIGTVTERTREVSIEAVMPGPTGCSFSDLNMYKPTTNVQNLLCQFQTELTSAYNQVFKSNDSESWNPLSGRYSRNVQWTVSNCSGDISTSMC